MNHYTIRQRLILLLILPIAALTFFGGSVVSQRRREANHMDDASRMTQVAVLAGQLLHLSQRERGMSAGLLGGNAAFAAQLPEARRATDGARAALEGGVSDLPAGLFGGTLAGEYNELEGLLAALAARRSAVDARAVQSAEVVAAYTQINRGILSLVAEIMKSATAGDLVSRGGAYVSFMRAKEAAGIERAVLTSTFGSGKFAPGMYARLLGLVALEEEHLASFRRQGSALAWSQYEEAMRGPFSAATRAMLEIALASGGGAVTGVEGPTWFRQQSAKIDAMAGVERWLATDIVARSAELSAEARRAFRTALALMAAVVLLTIVLSALVVQSIVRPLGSAVNVLGSVAAGDFTRQLEADGRDEVGQMARSLNHAVEAIRQALGEVRGVSASVASAAVQVSSASEEIATGAQRQASNLEETAAALEEITATVRQNSTNAAKAKQVAVRCCEVAERGGEVVGDAVVAIAEVNKASRQIGDIIGTIQEISFQTNLLALNAAVEAARAGEQGRGFAVVAAEVRELAQRSSVAARQTKALIDDSVHKVEVGTELVNRSGKLLTEIVASVKRVTGIVTDIASASKEQAIGVEQVCLAVSQMDEVTQSNAAKNQELSDTASAMAQQSEQLRTLVVRFQLDDDASEKPRQLTAL